MVLSIPRLITILIAIALYGVALFAIFRRSRRVKVSSSEDTGRFPFGYNGPERRIYPRAKFNLDVRYKSCDKRGELSILKEGKARDISEGGLLLETDEELAVNDKLELKLKLSLNSQYMLIKGNIVWAKEKEKEKKKWYLNGIVFTEIEPNDRKLIAKHVAESRSATVSGG